MRDDDFNESSYVRVNDRVKQFRKDYPEGRIETFREGEEGGVIFKCIILRDSKDAELYANSKIAAASGHSYLPDEAREDQKVEEYAETVSIGRALACLGYSADKYASDEEMEQFDRLQGNEEEEEPEEKPKRVRKKKTRRVAKKKQEEPEEDQDDEDEDADEDEEQENPPKLRSTRRIKRSSKLASRKRKTK